MTMLTSGSLGWAAEMAELDSSQPANSGVKAASIIATHADRARSPDMKWGAPILLKTDHAPRGPFWAIPRGRCRQNRGDVLRRNAPCGRPNVTRSMLLSSGRFLRLTRL